MFQGEYEIVVLVLHDEQAAVLDYTSRLRPPEEKLAQEGWLNPDFPRYVRPTVTEPPPFPEMPEPPSMPGSSAMPAPPTFPQR